MSKVRPHISTTKMTPSKKSTDLGMGRCPELKSVEFFEGVILVAEIFTILCLKPLKRCYIVWEHDPKSSPHVLGGAKLNFNSSSPTDRPTVPPEAGSDPGSADRPTLRRAQCGEAAVATTRPTRPTPSLSYSTVALSAAKLNAALPLGWRRPADRRPFI